MQLGDAVDRRAADAGQIGHSYPSATVAGAFVDERHASDPIGVVDEADPHLLQEARVYLIDDLEMARQKALEQINDHVSSASGSRVWFV
jgi:hypothetical protein